MRRFFKACRVFWAALKGMSVMHNVIIDFKTQELYTYGGVLLSDTKITGGSWNMNMERVVASKEA